MHEARQRALADQRAAFIDDLTAGVGCLTEQGAEVADKIVEALRRRADGLAPDEVAPASYTDEYL